MFLTEKKTEGDLGPTDHPLAKSFPIDEADD